ncbi:phage/plasmid primase, P4 family [Streptomyces nodosus]
MTEPKPTPKTPYRDGVAAYADAGWNGIIPIKRSEKTPYPGLTGEKGEQRTPEEAVQVAFNCRAANLALRLDRDMVGIDVDDYDGRNGAATLAGLEAKWGKLPATVYSTSRGAGTSGIRLFRRRSEGKFLTKFEPGIEIVQWHHRFVMCWPSVHPASRETYAWYEADGSPLDGVPVKDDIPFLPERWEKGLARRERKTAPIGPVETLEEPPAGLLAAIADVAGQIASLPPGSAANDPCNTAALKLSAYIPHAVSADYVRAQLCAAVDKWEDGQDKGYEAIESGLSVVGTDRHQPKNWTDTDGAGFNLIGSKGSNGKSGPCPGANDPMEVVRHLASEFQIDAETPITRLWNDQFWRYQDVLWRRVSDSVMRSGLYKRLDRELVLVPAEDGKFSLERWSPTAGKINNVMDAARAIYNFGDDAQPGTWLGDMPNGTLIPMQNGFLRLEDRELIEPSPRFFNTSVSPCVYNPKAKCPRWLRFINDELFPADEESARAVQQWFGYVVSRRTDIQKMMLMTGPTRGGRGTISKVLKALMSSEYIGVTLDSMAGEFGLESMLGKTIAIIGDSRGAMRRGGEGIVTERLLSISGEDELPINRKGREQLGVTLPTRIMAMSNQMLGFSDAGGALNGRWIVIKMTESFAGREDSTLLDKLLKELPGIFNWALEGLEDLQREGQILQPKSGLNMKSIMAESDSPHGAFVKERCNVGPQYVTTRNEIYQSWSDWNGPNGKPGNPNWLLRDLTNALQASGEGHEIITEEDKATRRTVWRGIAPIDPVGITLKSSNGVKK